MASKIDMVLTELTTQGKTLAAVEANQNSMHERIFGGQQPGIIHYLADKDAEIAKLVADASKDFKDALEMIKKDLDGVKISVTEIQTKRRVGVAYMSGAAGVGSALGYLIKAGLLRLGIGIH